MAKVQKDEEGSDPIIAGSDKSTLLKLLLLDDVAPETSKEKKQRRRDHNLLLMLLICTIIFLSTAVIVMGAVLLQQWKNDGNKEGKAFSYETSISEPSEDVIQQRERDLVESLKIDGITQPYGLDYLNDVIPNKNIERGCESTLLLFRHCYDNGAEAKTEFGDKHCSYQGYEQNHYLTTLFGESESARWPNPSRLYSLMFHQLNGFNYRLWETLKPISVTTGVPLQNVWYEDFQNEFLDTLGSGELCGQVMVASVKHAFLPSLAYRLGCGSKQGCPPVYDALDFDTVVQLKYVYDPPGVPEAYHKEQATVFEAQLNIGKNNHEKIMEGKTDKDDLNEEDGKLFVPGWSVYGAATHQRFDPLSFSSRVGDYHPSGVTSGGSWQDYTP